MKKLISIVVSVLLLLTTSFVFTSAMYMGSIYRSFKYSSDDDSEDYKGPYKDPFEVICDTCKYICYCCDYDEGEKTKKHYDWFSGMTISELFFIDLNHIKSHKGGSRQFANFLLYMLHGKGIEAFSVIFVGKVKHYAVMLEIDGNKYILDLAHYLAHNKDFSASSFKEVLIPLSEYWNVFKEYDRVWVIKDYPGNIAKRYSDLEPGVDYEIIKRPESE